MRVPLILALLTGCGPLPRSTPAPGSTPEDKNAPTVPTLSEERDEFTGRTNLTVEFWVGEHQLTVFAVPEGEAIGLIVATTSNNWRYLRCHTLAAVADHNPVPVRDAEHEGDVLSGSSVFEAVTVQLSPDTLNTLAAARESALRVCRDVIPLSEPHRVGLRRLLARYTELSAGTAAPTAQPPPP